MNFHRRATAGKTHAMFREPKLLQEIFWFTDADAVLKPLHNVRDSERLLWSKGLDSLSFVPGFTERGFIEDAIYPNLAMGFLHHYPADDGPCQAAGLALGPFIMVTGKGVDATRAHGVGSGTDYGRHRSGKAAKLQGMRLMALRGSDLVQVEPFRDIPQVFRYWRRVYYGGLEGARPLSRLIGYSCKITVVLLATYIIFSIAAIFLLPHHSCPQWPSSRSRVSPWPSHRHFQILFIKRERGNWLTVEPRAG